MDRRFPLSEGAAETRWLTPARGVVIAFAALFVGLGSVAAIFIVPNTIESEADRRERTGWLPSQEEVIAVQLSWAEEVGEEEAKPVTKDLPAESSRGILDCLARRMSSEEYWKRRKPQPPGVISHPDLSCAFWIELRVEDSRPVQIGCTRWGGVWVGKSFFVLPRDDFRKLQAILVSERDSLE